MRLDSALVQRGLARSRGHASQLIRAGRVLVDEAVATKPAILVTAASAIAVTPASDPDLASRAGTKLLGALDALADQRPELDAAIATAITNETGCLDIGASTGGFTDVLLRRGAKRVVALDVGHDQLRPDLRSDPRVTVVERTNIRDVDRGRLAQLAGNENLVPGFIVGDLSFISLTLVVPVVAQLLDPGGLALLLVKPQFEVGRERLAKDGVVKDAVQREQAVAGVVAAAETVGLAELARLPSPVRGATGNQEFFVLFERR